MMKNWLDLVVKIGSATAIFIPVLLFYLQYRNDLKTKKNETLSSLYVNIALNVQEVKNATFNYNGNDTLSNNILVKYPAEITVYKNDSLDTYYEKVAGDFKIYKPLKFFFNAMNILNSDFKGIFSSNIAGTAPNNPKKHFIKFADMSNADKVTQIDHYLPVFKAFDEETYHNVHTELNQIASAHPANAMFNKLGPVFNDAFTAANIMTMKLMALRSFLKDGNQEYFEYFYIPGPNRLSEPDQKMQDAMQYFRSGILLLQTKLENDQAIFQKKVLSQIKD